jgi:hypothetical protein
MKINIDKNEWYPVYEICSDSYPMVEVQLTEEEIKRINLAEIEFRECQKILRQRFKEKI